MGALQNVLVFFSRFELLETLSFDSVRRRMSVIVKSATGRNHILSSFSCVCNLCLDFEFLWPPKWSMSIFSEVWGF